VVPGSRFLRVHLRKGNIDCWLHGIDRGPGILLTSRPQRPFVADTHEALKKEIMRAAPKWPVTDPPVSTKCMDAIRKLLVTDTTQRIGAAGWSTYTTHPFFREIDFEALERKEIEPIFKPSSDKTNFDATYDLEELLLEEAPLEARARRQKPRERLKDDATAQEIREEELHKMIETLFEPFDYTTVAYDKLVPRGVLIEEDCSLTCCCAGTPGPSILRRLPSVRRPIGSARRRTRPDPKCRNCRAPCPFMPRRNPSPAPRRLGPHHWNSGTGFRIERRRRHNPNRIITTS